MGGCRAGFRNAIVTPHARGREVGPIWVRSMQEAFRVLDAIAQGAGQPPEHDHTWVEALKTISWVVETGGGLRLTADGRQAHRELSEGRARARPRGRTLA